MKMSFGETSGFMAIKTGELAYVNGGFGQCQLYEPTYKDYPSDARPDANSGDSSSSGSSGGK